MTLPRFRHNATGHWYKGNTHIHSTVSDGGKTFAELARMYAGDGFDFLFRTDHWQASDAAGDTTEYPLLWLDGVELDGAGPGGANYHVVCLGTFSGFQQEEGLEAAMQSARDQGGLLILAHPHWTGNSLEDAVRWPFDGVEIYNHVARWMNGKSDGTVHWSAMLDRFPETLAFAADDAHIRPEHPGWNGGWIMVNAPACSREDILTAIRTGNFYSSCGPEIHSIESDGRTVSVRTSPVKFIRLVSRAWRGRPVGTFDGRTMTETTLELPGDWPYVYLEVEDTQGRRAWTQTLFKRD